MKYTNEELLKSAQRFSSRQKWKDHDGRKEYQTARARGILKECTVHMIDQRTVRTYSDEEIIKRAKKFRSSTEWRQADSIGYRQAVVHGILHLCTIHMPRHAGIYSGIYQVYSYQFPDNVAYVGLTCVPEQRHEQHRTGGRVLAWARHLGVPVPDPIIIQDQIMSPKDGQEAECHWIEQFKSEGWTLLNKANGGSIGRIGGVVISKWTKEIVLDIARQFHTVRDWIQFNSGSYAAASKNGWLLEATAHMIKPRPWTKQRMIQVASQYTSVAEFCNEQASCAVVANRVGLYHEITAHMTRKCHQPRKLSSRTILARQRTIQVVKP